MFIFEEICIGLKRHRKFTVITRSFQEVIFFLTPGAIIYMFVF